VKGGFENFIPKVPNSFIVWYFRTGYGIEICFSQYIILCGTLEPDMGLKYVSANILYCVVL